MSEPNASLPCFRLKRVITIDSYSPGGETILDVDGGAIITGANGVGKTSLLRLIPVFFGELPSRISVGSETFVRFYLSRTTSYIVFEYERRGVDCLAVMYAASSKEDEEGYAYRFIRAPYSLDLFTTESEDGHKLVPSEMLPTHLMKMGVIHTAQLAQHAYRAIIQGRVSAGKGAANDRKLVDEFAFTTPNNNLEHIDKIVSGMFRRKAEFKDFLRMVVSYISDKSDPFILPGDRGAFADWPKQYAAYQRVMECSGLVSAAVGLDAQVSDEDRQLSIVRTKLEHLSSHSSALAQRLSEQRRVLQATQEIETAAYQKADEQFRKDEATFKAEAAHYEGIVKNLDRMHAAFELEGIEEKAALVVSLPTINQDIQTAAAHKDILLGAKGDIEQRFEALKQHEIRFLQEQKEVLSAEKDRASEKHDAATEAFNQSREPLEAEARAQHEMVIAGLQEAVAEVDREIAVAKHKMANPVPDPAIVARLAEKRNTLDQLQKSIKQPRDRVTDASRATQSAKLDFEAQDQKVVQLVQEIERLDRDIAALKQKSVPDPGSLLAFLRAERPDWPLDIAKVINESLLSRTDLSPDLVGSIGEAFYGVSLDLSKIDCPLMADEAALLAEIQTQTSRKDALKARLNEERNALTRLNTKLSEARAAEELARQALSHAESLLATTIDEEKACRAEEAVSIRNCVRELETVLTALQGALAQKTKSLRDAQLLMKNSLEALKSEAKSGRQRLQAEKQRELDAINLKVAACEKSTQEKIQVIDSDRTQALNASGVDTKSLEAVETRLKALDAQARAARAAEGRVAEWRSWLNNEWTHREEHVITAGKRRQLEAETRQRRESADATWGARRSQLQTDITKLGADADAADKTVNAVVNLIARNQLERYRLDEETRSAAFDPVWTLELLATQTNQAISRRNLAYGDLVTRINQIKRTFLAAAGTPTGDYFVSFQGTVDPDNNAPRAWVTPFKEWFESKHKENLRILLLQGRKFGEQIIGLQLSLEGFSKQIQSFNRKMQDALDKTVVFSRVSSVQIHFNSTISNKAYWAPINAFVQNNEAWIRDIKDTPPPPTFVADLEHILEHWDLREGIRAERLSLIDVSGEVVENGVKKRFRDSASLGELSSNGLSYLILTVIFVAFLRMIRGDADVRVTYAVDELGDLDLQNIGILIQMLRENGIDLVSACPGNDFSVFSHFKNRYRVQRESNGPELVEVELVSWENGHV